MKYHTPVDLGTENEAIVVAITDPLSKTKCKLTAVSITPLTLQELLDCLGRRLNSAQQTIVAGHNLHSAYLYHTDPVLREFYSRSTIVLADGAPIKWDYKLSGGTKPLDRLGSTDWIPLLDRIADLERICVIGASETSNARFVEWLSDRLPAARVEGMPGSGWSNSRAASALQLLDEFRPQLVLLGIGMPLQERFAIELLKSELPIVVATVGGAIDQLSGVQRNAPRWTGRLGLEWLWRLLTQPTRLWRRYLIEPWKLLWLRVMKRA